MCIRDRGGVVQNQKRRLGGQPLCNDYFLLVSAGKECNLLSVSYTHLDVYKRQAADSAPGRHDIT